MTLLYPRTFAGVAQRQHLMNNVFFDTCVYHQPGIDLLAGVLGPDNILDRRKVLELNARRVYPRLAGLA